MSLKTIALRIGQAVLVIWATFTLSFILLAALPGDAVATRYDNPNLGLNAEQLAAIREVYGADEPLLSRYTSARSADSSPVILAFPSPPVPPYRRCWQMPFPPRWRWRSSPSL